MSETTTRRDMLEPPDAERLCEAIDDAIAQERERLRQAVAQIQEADIGYRGHNLIERADVLNLLRSQP